MRLCFVLPDNIICGGVFTVFEHARRLAARGHSVTVAFVDETHSKAIVDYPGMEQVETAYFPEVRAGKVFDVAVATFWETANHIFQVPAKRYAYFVQGFEDQFYDVTDERRERVKATFRSDFIYVTVSRALASFLEAHYQVSAAVVPNPVNEALFESPCAFLPRGETKRVLVEGDPNWELKRVELALRVLEAFPELEVMRVSATGWGERTWAKGRTFQRVPYARIPALYSSCDFILKLSRSESFSLPVMEMFAAGGTAVVSAFSGHDEYIHHDENALVVPIDDYGAALAAVRRLVQDDGLLRRLQSGAARTFRQWQEQDGTSMLESLLAASVGQESKACLPSGR